MSTDYQITNEEIDAYIAANWDDFVADARKLVSIDSSFDPDHAQHGAPFGPGPRRALDAMLQIAERIGFVVHDGEGYAGYADLAGESGQQIGIIGHVDVVPAGEGWLYPPFDLTLKDGALIGRGTADDKVPLLCALYACKYWMDRGITLNHAVRFIFGCNEETGMADVPYYLAHNEAPDFLFTPDADFPLCYGEKGLFGVTLENEVTKRAELVDQNKDYESINSGLDQVVLSFEGGSATNAVPSQARAVVAISPDQLPKDNGISVESHRDGALIIATGVSGHASRPEGTVNAIGVLSNYLAGLKQCSEEEQKWFSFVAANLAGRTDGSPIGIAAMDNDFGALTCVVGTMKKISNCYVVTVDIRFPAAITGAVLTETFENLADHVGAKLSITRNQEPFIVNPNTAAVQALMHAYETTTNLEVRPFTMGGATYAREFPHAVSFGPADPEVIKSPEWVGEMHGANEGITEEAIRHAIRIYVRAFGGLAQVQYLNA